MLCLPAWCVGMTLGWTKNIDSYRCTELFFVMPLCNYAGFCNMVVNIIRLMTDL